MKELFQNTPLYIPTRNPDHYKNKYQTTIKEVEGGWFLENTDSKIQLIKIRRL